MSVAVSQRLGPGEFDLCGPLPTGVTVLEASAGTGKTYTIAGLAARYVASGIPLGRLLLVTFTRIATGELRERVRERLTEVQRGLGLALSGRLPAGDPLVKLLASGDRAEVGARRMRLAAAVAGFDAATIATTHGFCQEALTGLGVAGDLEPDAALLEDPADLVDEVVDDLYVRRFHGEQQPPFDRAQAATIARAAIAGADAVLVAGDSDTAQMRLRLAFRAREELELRKRQASLMTYDDLVVRLRSALAGPGGASVAAQLRRRYEVVLVDEFQDTDRVQWEIVRRAFGQSGVTLVLIADPKQAIYAFRGADVYAYLDAARAASGRATLAVNWRSDQGLIDAHHALLAGVRLGHEGIEYRRVQAAPAHLEPRLSGAPCDAPLRVRVVDRTDPEIAQTGRGNVVLASGRAHVCRDLAADLVSLLTSSAHLEQRAPDGRTLGSEPVCPADLAVLVRTNFQATMVRDALAALSVPAVINGAGSVFAEAGARDWLTLLEALERPASGTRARAAALTPFLGWTAERLAECERDPWAWEAVHGRLHEWSRVLRGRGVAAMLEAIASGEGLAARVLRFQDGERRLTDLRHVGRLLHAAARDEQLGVTALTAWLRTRIAEAGSDTADEERTRRLESDADAVQVLTIHRSKGLEFPIVYLPFLWDCGRFADQARPVFFHDPQAGDARTLDVGLEGPEYAAHRRQHEREERGEELRLAYVALTRARHQVVAWWAGSYDSRNAPLTRLLFSRNEAGDVAAAGARVPDDRAFVERVRELDRGAPGCVSVEAARPGPARSFSPLPGPGGALQAARFDRTLDLRWRRTSYSDIAAAAHEAWVASEPEQPLPADEPEGTPMPAGAGAKGALWPSAGGAREHHAALAPSPLAGLPVGVRVGTFVHQVLQDSDFAALDPEQELAARIADRQGAGAPDIGDPRALAAALSGVLQTPLGAVLRDMPLCRVARADRLDELTFELPVAGGDRPRGTLRPHSIARLLRARLHAGDPLAAYADRLEDPALRPAVRGYLTGSLDLVMRLEGGCFAVVDYKTNWLAGPDEALTLGHYRPRALAAEMLRHHYALQALLYCVALHRYLRWRLRGYDPDRDLLGVVYLFVRGMAGPDTPMLDGAPCGVFGWRPPAGLVGELSDLLDTG